MVKHLELIQKDNAYYIKINTFTGRLSLFVDHPEFKYKDFKNKSENLFKTVGDLNLVAMLAKDVFILEDTDPKTFKKSQNFIYVDAELTKDILIVNKWPWFLKHAFEFITKSLSIFYFVVYMVLLKYYAWYYGLNGIIHLGKMFGSSALILIPSLYYVLWSSRTKSSFLKVAFTFELVLMLSFALVYLALMQPMG